MRNLIVLFLLISFGSAAQAEVYQFPSPSSTEKTIVIYSSTDVGPMEVLIREFQSQERSVAIEYHDLDTLEIYRRVVNERQRGVATADLVLSSAMDLQIKLVNDGFAKAHISKETEAAPAWSKWRNEAFGFTFEPAVMVYNKVLAPELAEISTRFHLAQALNANGDRYRGKVTTYDPKQSGLGYLFGTQDAVQSADFWYLARSLGESEVHQTASSSAMIRRIAEGQSLIAYNVLGSYALARARENGDLGITLLSDYSLVMSRIAVVLKDGRHSASAGAFVNFLLSPTGQRLIAGPASLYALRDDVNGELTVSSLRAVAQGPLIPIKLGPGLLVYLDALKRQDFLNRWAEATGQ